MYVFSQNTIGVDSHWQWEAGEGNPGEILLFWLLKRSQIGVASPGNRKMLGAITWKNTYLRSCNTQTTVRVNSPDKPAFDTQQNIAACVSLTRGELVAVAVNVEHGVGNTSARWLQWTDTRVKGQSRAAAMDFNSGNVGQCSGLALPDCFSGICSVDVRAKAQYTVSRV